MKYLLSFLKFFFLCYFGVLSFLYFFQRKLIYLPSKEIPLIDDWKDIYRQIETKTKDHLILKHWYAKQNPPYIIIFHGNSGHIEERAYKFNFLIDAGYSILLNSYRGYGGNAGKSSEPNFISDSVLVMEWLLKTESISPKDVILIGESLGSAVTVAVAAQYHVKGLIFDGAFSSITDVAQSVYPFLPVHWLLKDTWNSISRIQKVNSPSFFIHSKKDKVVPFRFGKKLFEKAKEPKEFLWLEDSSHNTTVEKQSVQKHILKFIESLK